MNVGDRVRLLSGSEEGVVVKIGTKGIVEVEIDDGFVIPVMKNELVLVSGLESRYFGEKSLETDSVRNSEEDTEIIRPVVAHRGLFLAFVPINDQRIALKLINNTDFDCAFTFYEKEMDKHIPVRIETLSTKKNLLITEKRWINFDEWNELFFQFIFFNKSLNDMKAPLVTSYKPRAGHFRKKTSIPMIDEQGYFVRLDDEKYEIDSDKILESIEIISRKTDSPPKEAFVKSEIDIHAEELGINQMDSSEILKIQLDTFEKHFDKAVQYGNHDFTVIHGIGNGTLRHQVHKILSGHPHVAYFKDAHKDKFGYGATYIKIK